MDFSTLTLRTAWSIFYIRGILLFSCFIEIAEINVNPDQTTRFVASDLGLRCLPSSVSWDTGLKWFKHLLDSVKYEDEQRKL